ncbi:MAG: metal ABC transporter permease [Lachnospiraceae bacterium]|nr:metal ABC transporter permease [Lachnospiraceae bacterium]
MAAIFDKLSLYLSYPFVWYAIIVGVLIAACAALLGVPVVLRRYSLIGDGLSHVAFGAMAVATVLNLSNNMLLVIPVTVLTAVFLMRRGKKSIIKGDAALAMLSVGAMAIGYLVLNMSSNTSNLSGDVCSTLFGSQSIITLTGSKVIVCAVCSALVIAGFVLLYNRIFAVTFDEDFSVAAGMNTGLVNLLLSVMTALIIVLAMNLVGTLLISALVTFPALSAMRICGNYRSVTVCALIISVACTILGIIISIAASSPVGATIVAVDICAFIGCFAAGKMIKRV